MKEKKYYILFGSILLLSLILRFAPTLGNNFYFTMDQARDALYVREVLDRHHLLLRGPETSIFGIYVGPLWFYFIAIGYLLFSNHPFGGVFMLIILNTVTLGIIMQRVTKEVSPKVGLAVGLILQTSWYFYDLSRYSFNPFPNFFLAIIGIFFLVDALRGNSKRFVLAAIPFALFFHTDLAPAIPANILYLGVGLFLLWRKKIKFNHLLFSGGLFLLLFLPHIVSEVANNFSQINTVIEEIQDPRGVFSGVQTRAITQAFIILVSRSFYEQIPKIGIIAFVFTTIFFLRKIYLRKANEFIKYFTILSLTLVLTSWLFFLTNLGWRDWQTAYLSPLVFLTTLLVLTEVPILLGVPLLLVSVYSHINIFVARYQESFRPSSDASILANEIAAVDWVYQNGGNQGFSVYSYLPSVYDYPYQYLFWWHGLSKYKYLPCEYSTFPNSPTNTPSEEFYRKPTNTCPTDIRFLIIEPDKNTVTRNRWLTDITQDTTLIEETNIGTVNIQRRQLFTPK